MIMSVFSAFRDRRPPAVARHDRGSFLSPYTEYRDWGRIDLPDPVRTARSGIARYRLCVYAPGTTDGERRELALARRWWYGSVSLTLGVELVVASGHLGAAAASVVALAGLAVAWYWLARTRTIRGGTRALQVAVVMVGSREVIGDAALFGQCRRELAVMDHAMGLGTTTPVEMEATWAAVYERLAPRGITPSSSR
jgi:hypothetical protein